METNKIKELMLSGIIIIGDKFADLDFEDKNGNYLYVVAAPKDSLFIVKLFKNGKEYDLTDEQYNMICKYVESEFNEYHSNNSAFTDDDKEHFNSLI